jgi:hypothetical protein
MTVMLLLGELGWIGTPGVESMFESGYLRPAKTVASFAGFYCSMTAMVFLLRLNFPLLCVVFITQLVDSAIFFPVAYATLDSIRVVEFMLVGFTMKVLIGWLYLLVVMQSPRRKEG